MGQPSTPAITRRLRIFSILGGAGAILVLVRFLLPGSSASEGGSLDGPAFDRELHAALDSLMHVYGIAPAEVRTRTIKDVDGTVLRTEQRVDVDGEFVALKFNHDLATRLRRAGARVVGTERVRERLTSLHVVHGGSTVWTLQFVLRAAG